MGTLHPSSTTAVDKVDEAAIAAAQTDHQLNAGALFVLKSKGTWLHCAYHLISTIVAPPLLSLPYGFRFLGWGGGIAFLIIGGLVTFYSYNMISLVLEHYAEMGHRYLRFRDLAHDILGPRWSRYYVTPTQFMVCYGAVIGCTLLGGQCLKTIYLLSKPDGTMKLYEFVIIFGCLMLILSQVPSFHALRHVSMISLFLSLAYSACTAAGSIEVGNSSNGPKKDYSMVGDTVNCIFGVFTGMAVIATTFGNGIIPEIQATLAPPVTGKMFKGLSLCYSAVTVTHFSVAISSYWAFGNKAEGTILSNFVVDGKPLITKWFLFMTNLFVILQLSAVGVLFCQPINEFLENIFPDPRKGEFSIRNFVPRLIYRSLAIAGATTMAAMLPFFGDINSLIGAFGFIPLDFVLPVVFFNLTFKPSKGAPIFWLNLTIIAVFSMLAVIATVSAVRQIVLDAKTYKLFANV